MSVGKAPREQKREKGYKTMDKVNAKMVCEAKAEFDAYCKKHGDCGKVQVSLENAWLEMMKAYAIRKDAIRQRFLNKNVVKFYEIDNFNSYAAFNILYNNVWGLVAEIVIAYEDGDEKGLDEAIRQASDEKRIKIGKLLNLLR